jgi:ribosomal protein S17E
MTKFPEIPDDDKDFTPELARKIIEKYQSFLNSRDDFIVNKGLWSEFMDSLKEERS